MPSPNTLYKHNTRYSYLHLYLRLMRSLARTWCQQSLTSVGHCFPTDQHEHAWSSRKVEPESLVRVIAVAVGATVYELRKRGANLFSCKCTTAVGTMPLRLEQGTGTMVQRRYISPGYDSIFVNTTPWQTPTAIEPPHVYRSSAMR